MLELQLAEARANRKRHFIRLTVILLGISLVGIGMLFLFTCCQGDPEAVARVMPPPEPNITAQPIVTDEAVRLAYLESFGEYETNIKPKLENINLSHWDTLKYEQLSSLEDQAITAFSQADYTVALTHLEALKTFSQTLIDDSVQQFVSAFSSAEAAYQEDDYASAKLSIDQALMLANRSALANELANKIAKLPAILPLLKQANSARVENNDAKELAMLEQIIQLAPERSAAVQRRQALTGNIKERKFATSMQQFYQAMEQGNAALAKQHLQQAERGVGKRQQITEAAVALQELEQEQRLQGYQQAIQVAITADDWVMAKQQLGLWLSQQAEDKLAQELLDKTNKIISLKQVMDRYIANPYRLADKRVAAKAMEQIDEAREFLLDSPSLQASTTLLAERLQQLNKQISVAIISDGQTYVTVRGIGVVGLTSGKIIQLSPGTYQFEGKRKGYKSKLIDVLLAYDKTSYQVTVICDEII